MIGCAYTPGLEGDTGGGGEKMEPVDIPDRFTPYVDPMDDLDPTKPPRKRKPRPRPAPPSDPPPDLPADFEPPTPSPARTQGPRSGVGSGGPMPDVKLIPAKPGTKSPPPARPKRPVKKNKVDKMLDEAEQNLKNL
jgi:hypothetical protein